MSRVDLEQYVPVEERLEKFWAKYPDGCVKTELLHADEGYVRIFAAVFKSADDRSALLATGLAEETREGYVNKTSAVENCETSAIGRALANGGFRVKRGPSREEMEKVKRLQEHEKAEKSRPQRKPEDIPMEQASPVDHGGALDEIKESEAEVLAESAKEWIGGDDQKKSRLRLKLVELGASNVDGRRKLASIIGELSPDAAKKFVEWMT